MNENWGLTENGFLRPSYNDLLDAFEVKAKELFGSTVNLTARSPLGIFLRIFAWFASLVWQLAEDIYNSGFIDTAAGISLARLGVFIGIRKLAAQKATGTVTITGDPGAPVYAGLLLQAHNNQRFVTMEDAVIAADGTVNVLIQAYDAGKNGNVEAGTIDSVVTPLSVITSVTNTTATSGGRDRETDQEFRERYAKSVDKPGGSNTDSIRAALLEVDGVAAAVVFENEKDEEDELGLPPHSVEAVVYGGFDASIAAVVHRHKAAGIQTFGTSNAQVADASGTARTIYFSRPTTKNIYVKIDNLVTGDDFPEDGENQITQAVINFIGSDTSGIISNGLSIGVNVYYNQLLGEILKVPGVVDFILGVGTDGIDYAAANIIIGVREKAVTSAAKVVIST